MTDDYLRELNKPTVRRKLPVFRTVGSAYLRVLVNLFAVLRISWFIVAILSLSSALVYSFDLTFPLPEPLSVIDAVLTVFLQAILIVGLNKIFIGETPSGFLYFEFREPERLNLLAGVLAALLFLIVVFSVLTAVGAALYFGLRPLGLTFPTPELQNLDPQVYSNAELTWTIIGAAFGLPIVFVLVGYYAAVAAQLPGINLLERKLGIARGWRRAKGNAWSAVSSLLVLVLTMAVFIAIIAIAFVVIADFLGFDVVEAMSGAGEEPATPDLPYFGGVFVAYWLLIFIVSAIEASWFANVYLALKPKPKPKPKSEVMPSGQPSTDGDGETKEDAPNGAEPAPAT